jgi:glycosyltransferase involved in cell wall biosynthesis
MSIETTPRVSVLIPMHNAEAFIVSTLTSVLQEKNVAIEVVVINDKSTDQSLQKALSVIDERIRIVDGPGLGIASCMNAGLAAAQGDIVMRCDADDHYPEGRISEQVNWLDAHPQYDAVCGRFATMDSLGRLAAEMATGDFKENITEELNAGKTRTHFCTFAIRKKSIHSVGGFRPYFVTAEDIDFQLRLGEIANVMYLPHSVYLYRLHDTSITHSQGNLKRIFFESTARLFQSQRKASGSDDLQRGCPPEPPEVQSDKPGIAAQQIQGILTGAAWYEHSLGRKSKAVVLGLRALRLTPFAPRMWWGVMALILKPVKNR